MSNKKEDMTVSELAVIISKSFDGVEKRLSRLEVGQAKLEVGQAKLEAGQKEIKQDLTFTARKYELSELATRVEKLEYKVTKLSK